MVPKKKKKKKWRIGWSNRKEVIPFPFHLSLFRMISHLKPIMSTKLFFFFFQLFFIFSLHSFNALSSSPLFLAEGVFSCLYHKRLLCLPLFQVLSEDLASITFTCHSVQLLSLIILFFRFCMSILQFIAIFRFAVLFYNTKS